MEEKQYTEENQACNNTFKIKLSTKDAAVLKKIRDHVAKSLHWNPRNNHAV